MKKYFIAASLLSVTTVFAQKNKTPDNWQTLNPATDKVYGTGSEEAYKNLKDKKHKTVIVAVIDSGTEIDHEDLKDVIWTNPGEIADNGIDDDHNGYIDDIHGWSFLGGKNGDINYEATELARMYQRMNKKFATADTTKFDAADAKEFTEFKKIKFDFLEEQTKEKQQLRVYEFYSAFIENVKKGNSGVFTKTSLKNYIPANETEGKVKKSLRIYFALGIKPLDMEREVTEQISSIGNLLKYNNMNIDSVRQYVVGDDPNNSTERFYGCNRVEGPDALHGTHVSGIIAAMRTNNLGIIGIANDLKIMPVRAIPNGDERDKDVANAIRYAVDNGATVINMSFGKYYSPDKILVDEAVKYAQSKDVLLIHAAGNESKNSDIESSFPNRELLSGETANNWIQVGASSYKKGKNILGSFSNYGKTKVDFFAPGVDINSTVCDNKYLSESGTSMAAPSAAGVAAIVREYYPELKASEVREVLMKTVVPYRKKVKVPGTKKSKMKLKELCISGGFVNVNNAILELNKRK